MQHPDEGTIHAWLDGALPPAEARSIEEHAASCAECAAVIAEARGLVAASSRILSALDAVPGGVLPAALPAEESGNAQAPRRPQASWWRSTPLRAAAAILLVGGVSWLATRRGVPNEITLAPSIVMTPAEDRAVAADTLAMASGAAQSEQKAAQPAAPGLFPPPRVSELAPGASRAAPLRQESAKVAAQSAAQSAARSAARPAAPSAIADMAAAGSVSANAARGDTASLGAERSYAATSGVISPPPSAGGAATEQRRMVAPSAVPSAPPIMEPMTRSAAEPMAKMSSALAAAPILQSDALGRLLGCYVLEEQGQSTNKAQARTEDAASAGAQPSSSLLPARIELRADRADDLDATAMVLRPAPGEPAFAASARGRWRTLGANVIEMHIDDGARSVAARLKIAGDSVSGLAQSYVSGRRDSATQLRGRRASCPAP